MIDDLKLRERAFKKRAQMDYYKAKQYYRSGNKLAAKQSLKKWTRLNTYAERYINYCDRLRNVISSVNEAIDNKSVDIVIKEGLDELAIIQAAIAEIDQVVEKEAEEELSDLEEEVGEGSGSEAARRWRDSSRYYGYD